MAGVNAPVRRKNAVVEPVLNSAAVFVRQRTSSKLRNLKHISALWAMEELRLHQLPAIDVAEELTLMDAALLRRIRAEELKEGSWMNKEKKHLLSPNVLEMVKLSNQLAVLVPKEVLEGTTYSARAKILSAFIKIASKCHRLRNYNSLKAVLAGLQCTPIYRLKRTWKEVPAKRKKKFDQLSALMSEECNWKAYRSELHDCIVSKTPCVPFLGVLLTSIVQQESFHFTQSKQQLARKQSVLEGYTILEAITVRNRLERLRRSNYSKFSTVTLPSLKATLKPTAVKTVHSLTEEVGGTRDCQSTILAEASGDEEEEAIALSSIACVVEDSSENRKPEFLKLFRQQSLTTEIGEELSHHRDIGWSEANTTTNARPNYRKKFQRSVDDQTACFSILQEVQAVADGIDFSSSNYMKSEKRRLKLHVDTTENPRDQLVNQQKLSLIEMGQIELDMLTSSSEPLSARSSSSCLDHTPPRRRKEMAMNGHHPLSFSSVSSQSPHSMGNHQPSIDAYSSYTQVHHMSNRVDTDSHQAASTIDTDLHQAANTIDADSHQTANTIDTDLHNTSTSSNTEPPPPPSSNSDVQERASSKPKETLARKRSNAITEYDIEKHRPQSPLDKHPPPSLKKHHHPLAMTTSRSLEGLMDLCLDQNEVESPLTKTTSLQTIDNASGDEGGLSASQSSLLQCLRTEPSSYALNVDSSSSSLQSSGSDVNLDSERRPSVTYVRQRRRASVVIRVAQIEHPKNPIDLLPKYQFLSLGCCTRAEDCRLELKALIAACPATSEAHNYKVSYEREPS